MPIRWAYLKRVLAGAIFGLYMAHLLYFLNPQLDITPGRLATVTILYGLICSILWGLRALRVKVFGRPGPEGTYRAHGFGFVVFAAFIAAIIYWLHINVLRIYLPVGAWRVMAKATNLITIVAFALLLLWVLERNADRRMSRILFLCGVLLIAVSSFFLYQRRDSYRTETRNVVVANVGTVAGQRPVILVAIRNLPYDWIVTLNGEGRLPFFKAAREGAYFARIEPFPTTTQKSLWASLATGKLPFRHGVAGRFSYRTPLNGPDPRDRFLILPSGVGFQAWGLIPPVQRIAASLPSGDALPLWTMFERLQFPAAVIAWPSSQPRGASLVVTDQFFAGRDKRAQVVPPEFAEEALRTLESPSPSTLQRFNVAGAARPRVISGLSNDLSAMALLRAAVDSRRYELSVAALEGFGDAQRAVHVFGNELPAGGTPKGETMRAYVEQLDRMLASLAADHPDHLLVVVSVSGPAPPALPATPLAFVRDYLEIDDPGADDGFMTVSGLGSAHREKPESAYAVDVVPTVLYAAGLPVASDMDGRVIIDAFADEVVRSNALSVIQTYEAKQVIVRRGLR